MSTFHELLNKSRPKGKRGRKADVAYTPPEPAADVHTPPKGYTPIPNSAKGGYRKRVGDKWVYWYMGHGHVAGHEQVRTKLGQVASAAAAGLPALGKTLRGLHAMAKPHEVLDKLHHHHHMIEQVIDAIHIGHEVLHNTGVGHLAAHKVAAAAHAVAPLFAGGFDQIDGDVLRKGDDGDDDDVSSRREKQMDAAIDGEGEDDGDDAEREEAARERKIDKAFFDFALRGA